MASSTSGRVTPTPPPKGCELICENVFDSAVDGSDGDDELLKRREPTMQRRGKKLVAPLSQEDARFRRYTLVLDLDETVVYARNGPLYTRAYLRDFLSAIKDDFEVIVWTAGDREYAKNVLAGINVGHVVDHLIYRHRKWFNEEDYTKDLRQLGRDLDYTIIVENTPDCVRRNPGNGIIVEDFEVPPAEEGAEGDSGEPTPQPTPPPPADPTTAQQKEETATPPAEAEPSPSPKPKRVTTDRTLLLLREVLERLAASGETVPVFLSHCELLSRQTVTGCDGNDIPIHYLGTRRRRRDAGSPRKAVKVNRDRVSLPPGAGGEAERGPSAPAEEATAGAAPKAPTTPEPPAPPAQSPPGEGEAAGRRAKRPPPSAGAEEERGRSKTPKKEG